MKKILVLFAFVLTASSAFADQEDYEDERPLKFFIGFRPVSFYVAKYGSMNLLSLNDKTILEFTGGLYLRDLPLQIKAETFYLNNYVPAIFSPFGKPDSVGQFYMASVDYKLDLGQRASFTFGAGPGYSIVNKIYPARQERTGSSVDMSADYKGLAYVAGVAFQLTTTPSRLFGFFLRIQAQYLYAEPTLKGYSRFHWHGGDKKKDDTNGYFDKSQVPTKFNASTGVFAVCVGLRVL